MKKIFFYAFGLMCALSAQAAVIQVTSDKSGTELQAAINAASSGIHSKCKPARTMATSQ